jgi:hypothetical protein
MHILLLECTNVGFICVLLLLFMDGILADFLDQLIFYWRCHGSLWFYSQKKVFKVGRDCGLCQALDIYLDEALLVIFRNSSHDIMNMVLIIIIQILFIYI